MHNFNIGDLVWIPDTTYGHGEDNYKYMITGGPKIGIIISHNQQENFIKAAISTKKGMKRFTFSNLDVYNIGE